MADESNEQREQAERIYKSSLPTIPCTCPHCDKEFGVNRIALFEENSLISVLSVKRGHYLQASTLGGHLIEMSKMLKEAAAEMGVKIEVLVPRITVKNGEIRINFTSVMAGEKPKAEEKAAAVTP